MKRSYSRRELYALGEPLGDSATYRKVGGLVLGDGGGGGGGSAAPDKTTQTVELPEWARPYAKDVLAKGASLTDINQNPYQQYGGNRIAGFSPMQMRSFQGAANMDAGPRGFQEQVGQYMSPYMQNVVDVEKRGAIRDYQIGNTMQQAQATQAGAFGGGREAIQRAERERGLMGTLGGIQARGAQSAFDQASNQFRQGIQQGVAVNQLQNQYGGQMQQQAQRPLDMAYQDFLNQQNYPYKQLGFMSDLVRGMPLGQKSTSTVYEAPGSTMGQLAGLGMGAYGLSQMGMKFADGGQIMDGESVVRYADGGVTSSQNVEGILGKLSDQQLQQAKEAALNRQDVEQAQMIDAELAQRASIRNGLGGAFNQIPEEQQEQMMAGGGIVAFADRGAVVDKTKKTLSPTVESAVSKLAAQTGEPEQDLRAETQKNVEMFKRDYQPLLDQINRSVEEARPDTEAIKQQGLGQALAQFGFKMAAAASKPGARFLESASAAAPELSSAAAKTQELMSAQQQNYNKLKMDQAKYEVALQNGNMKDAAILAGQIRAGRQADKQLAATMAHYQDQFNIQQEQLKVQRQQVAATAARQPEDLRSIAAVLMKDDPSLTMSKALEQASRLRFGAAAEINAGAKDKSSFIAGMDKINESYPPMIAKPGTRMGEERARAIAELQRLTGVTDAGASAPAGGGSNIIRFDAKGNPI
jgi:hypothetical protein